MKYLFLILPITALIACSSNSKKDSNLYDSLSADIPATTPATEPAPRAQTSTVDWGYDGVIGPAAWSNIKSDYSSCITGTVQSPINLQYRTPVNFSDIQFAYNSSDWRIERNGKVLQVNFTAGNHVTIHGKQYQLVQMSFHAPSEHTLSNNQKNMEIQLIHVADDNSMASVSVLVNSGAANPTIQQIWNNIPLNPGEQKLVSGNPLNAIGIIPGVKTYYKYEGSLSIPPCTEGVTRVVLNTPVELSPEQIGMFKSMFNNSNRPLQNINGRRIENFK